MQPPTTPAPDRRVSIPSRPATAPFVRVPIPLLTADARDRAIYALIARLYALTRGPVPLSAADLRAYDPTLSYGAASRCLGRLVHTGWLLPHTRRGQKTCYTPTWGPGRPGVGTTKPRRLATVPLPAMVLDSCLGKLTPCMDAPATVARYTSVPLLTLADVGVYIQALTGSVATTDALERYGLVCNGVVGPLPTVADTLARVTQQTLAGEAEVHLTQAGARMLGLPRAVPPPPRPTTDAQPLFFVERYLIGGLIDHLIARDGPGQGSGSPARSGQRQCDTSPKMIPWNAWSHESTNRRSLTRHESHGPGVQGLSYVMSSTGTASRPRADLIHQQLNPDRTILPGEWLELAALHDQHGAELLIWQARAQRARRTRVTPDYYRACATQDALATRRSQRVDRMATTDGPPAAPVTNPDPVRRTVGFDPPTPVVVLDQERVVSPAPVPPPRGDAARRTLLDQLGQAAGEPVRCPRLLDQVAPELLVAWTRVVGHAGLRARFADPLGFAIRQLQQGHSPPPQARLDAWARSAAPSATPWTVDDVARLNREYGDVFRLGSGRTVVPNDGPRPPTGSVDRAGPWTAAEVARLNQEYGDLFRLGSAGRGPQASSTMTTADGPRGKPDASHRTLRAGVPTTPPRRQVTRPATASSLTRRLVAELRLRAGRGPLQMLLDQVTLMVQNGIVHVQCRDGTQVAPVYTYLVPLLPTVLVELGVRARVVVHVRTEMGDV